MVYIHGGNYSTKRKSIRKETGKLGLGKLGSGKVGRRFCAEASLPVYIHL